MSLATPSGDRSSKEEVIPGDGLLIVDVFCIGAVGINYCFT